MKRFRLKLTLTILGLITTVLILIGIFSAKVLEHSYQQTLSDLLYKESQLISEAVHSAEIFYDPEALHDRVSQFSQSAEARLTVIDRAGNVLVDTSTVQEEWENHADRPEFRSALAGKQGLARRYSETMGYDMIYVATPVMNNGEVIGAVRSAMSLNSMENAIQRMWLTLLTGLFVTLIIASLVSSRIAFAVIRPIEEITRVAYNITQRQFGSRATIKTRDEIGQLAGAINFMASSLQQQMVEISENQQRLFGVLNNMVSGVLFITEDGKIALVNPAAEKIFAKSKEELERKPHVEALNHAELSRHIDYCVKNGQYIRIEVHITNPVEHIHDVNIAPYINLKGEVKGVVVVLHDITEIRRLEKMRSQFVANVSHELRTPITSIKGFTETLLDGAMYDEETCRSFLQIISDESERLSRLITGILNLSKIEQRHITLHMSEVNLHQTVIEAITLLQEQIQRKNLAVEEPVGPEITIQSDRDCLQQILVNLLSNAVAYTPEGGSIRVDVKKTDRSVMLRVSDTGIGISAEDQQRIFERFYRVDKARSRDSGGSGLGLAIVKHLVETLDGHITVQSKEGVGTTFTVHLPL